MNAFSCTVVPTADVSEELTRELVSLAADAVGSSFDRGYVERRLSRYPSVAIARDLHGVAAFELLDVRRRGMSLVYLGPLFSRRGAYVALFADCLRRFLDSGEPFCIGMEIENALVRDVLALLLPTCAHPRRGEPPSEIGRALSRIFAAEFPHVKGLDELTMTTAIDEWSSGRSASLGRYQLALVPCIGDSGARERLRAELERGLESIGARRKHEGFEEAARERDLLRADP